MFHGGKIFAREFQKQIQENVSETRPKQNILRLSVELFNVETSLIGPVLTFNFAIADGGQSFQL